MQLVDNKKVDGEGQPKDEEGQAPLPQLTTQEALSMDVGEEEDPPGPERREENVKTNNHRRKKKEQTKPGDLFYIEYIIPLYYKVVDFN